MGGAAYGRQGESTSMPPGSVAGVPAKSNAVLFVGLGLGLMAIIGIVGIVFYLRSAHAVDPLHGMPSGLPSASVAVPAASSVRPVPVPTPTPSPEPAPTETASAASDAGEAPPPDTTSTATAETKPTPPPPPEPAPGPGPGPVAHPAPGPAPALVPATTKDAGAPLDPNAFNEPLARSRLSQANGVLVFCNTKGVTGPGSANITFSPDGTVGTVALDPPYGGTPAGDCVTGQFKRQKVTPFQGSPHTIKHTFDVPK
jgi:hypothetical protein